MRTTLTASRPLRVRWLCYALLGPMLSFNACERSLSRLEFLNLSILVLLTSSCSRLHAQTESRYEIVVSKNVMIPMRDGVLLATDIYRPGRNGFPVDGKFPTILERTPYNKDGVLPAEYF